MKSLGQHIILDFFECDSNSLLMYPAEADGHMKKIVDLIESHGFTVLDSTRAIFPNDTYTALFLLSESHVSIHTWHPNEGGMASIDIYTCNHTRDNSAASHDLADAIIDIFQPTRFDVQTIKR